MSQILIIVERRRNKGALCLLRMGTGDFSRPDLGRLKPPLPQTNAPKTGFITFAKLNNIAYEKPASSDSRRNYLPRNLAQTILNESTEYRVFGSKILA